MSQQTQLEIDGADRLAQMLKSPAGYRDSSITAYWNNEPMISSSVSIENSIEQPTCARVLEIIVF